MARKPPTRRQVMAAGAVGGALLAAGGLTLDRAPEVVPGRILGADAAHGHRLRGGGFPPVTAERTTGIAIIGGGIAGLAAARHLTQRGFTDFTLFELESEAGGNAVSGRNDVSAYPWGAHYVPLVTEESTEVRRLFEELGIITGYDAAGLPIYDEFMISAAPQERLFLHGRWQDGLVPLLGGSAAERAEFARFHDRMENFGALRGADGRRAFAIPVDASSADAHFRALDRETMKDWMNREGFTADRLHQHVDYCCRDDYGTSHEATSAWAGIHYFAARSGRAANAGPDAVVTWPEGNGWLVQRLAKDCETRIETGMLAFRIEEGPRGVTIDILDTIKEASFRVRARTVVLAVPRFIASRLLPRLDADGFTYAPWAVANITLGRVPEGRGQALAWDNVVFGSRLLGYVVATHQDLRMVEGRTVLTYYWPLSHLPPAEARREALSRDITGWQAIFLEELLRIHPELEGAVERVDVRVFGHAMIRPVPGFIWGEARRRALLSRPPVFAAHSDLGGMSIFEEAYVSGIGAAGKALDYLAGMREG